MPHPEHLAPGAGTGNLTPRVHGPDAVERYLQQENRGGRVASRGRLLSLAAVRVERGVGGERERHAAAGFVGGGFIGGGCIGAVARDLFDACALNLELARRVEDRAPVTSVAVVEDPRAEHDRQDDTSQVRARVAGQRVDRPGEDVLIVRLVGQAGLEGPGAPAPPLDVPREAVHVVLARDLPVRGRDLRRSGCQVRGGRVSGFLRVAGFLVADQGVPRVFAG